MMMKQSILTSVLAVTMFSFLAAPSRAAAPPGATSIPDFTQGDQIPEGATHD